MKAAARRAPLRRNASVCTSALRARVGGRDHSPTLHSLSMTAAEPFGMIRAPVHPAEGPLHEQAPDRRGRGLGRCRLGLTGVVGFTTEAACASAWQRSTRAAPRSRESRRSTAAGFTAPPKIELNFVPDPVPGSARPGREGRVPPPSDRGGIRAWPGRRARWRVLRLVEVGRAARHRAPGVTELQQTLGVPYVFEFRGRTGFGGNLAFDADAPAFDLPIDEALLKFSGATFDGTFDGARDLSARMHVAALDFTSPTGTVRSSTMSARAPTTRSVPVT